MENKNYSGRNGKKAGKRFFPCKIFYCTVERHLVTLRNDCWLVKFLFNICDSKFFRYTRCLHLILLTDKSCF